MFLSGACIKLLHVFFSFQIKAHYLLKLTAEKKVYVTDLVYALWIIEYIPKIPKKY